MTKILHIITDVNIGGAGHHLLALLNNLGKDFTAEVVVPEKSRLIPLLRERNVKYHEVPYIAAQSYSRAGTKVLRRKIKEIRPHIVHTHASLSGRIAARKYGKCKIVNTVHSAYPVPPWRKRFPFKQFSGRVNNKYSDRIIAVSPVTKRILLDMGTAEKKIRVILNGMPPAKEFSSSELSTLREKYNVPQDAFVVSYIARIAQIKGHDCVLDAARELPYNVVILFAGDGDYESHIKSRIEKESLRNVKMLGFVEKVDEILAITDVQINASHVSEATSLSLVSGMSAGKPAIVTNFSGNPYVIENDVNGLLVPPCDPQALDDAITRLRQDKGLYARLCEGAKLRYKQKFSARRMAEETEKVYRELM